MSYVNEVKLVGNLGQDAEVRSFQNGGRVANLSVATTRKWKNKSTNETREETEWHRIAITNDFLVGIAEDHAKKGRRVFINGRLKTRKWQDQGGQDRYTTEIVVAGYEGQLIIFDSSQSRSGGDGGGQPGGGASGGNQAPGPRSDLDDEIPF